MSLTILTFILIIACFAAFAGILRLLQQQKTITKQLEHLDVRLAERERAQQDMRENILQQRQQFDEHQLKTLKLLQESLQLSMGEIRQQVTQALNNHANLLTTQVEKLTQNTDQHLKEISSQVEKRLSEGFEKTTATFADVLKRLALIDQAQQKITELSSNVVSLQEVLADKRSRGAFGEVQLSALLRNVLPENNFALQHTLSNGKRADCILFLPEPTGNVVVDAKFPLENYRRYTDIHLSEIERQQAEQQFRQDIRKHINDIAEKYIIAGETADGAVMFIPAEAIFAEIHAHHPELVEVAQQARVWMVSPTTMMAILTTARAVLKDAATRKQVHIIQEHLTYLSKDFARFQERMDNLAKHIQQANIDVEQVQRSSQKITSRFDKIERVELLAQDQDIDN